jgi:hypothetical protein
VGSHIQKIWQRNTAETPLVNLIKKQHTAKKKKESDRTNTDGHGCPPMMRAAEHGHTLVVELMLWNGADAEVADKHGFNATEQTGPPPSPTPHPPTDIVW